MSRAESRGSRARRNAVRPGASTLDPGPSTALAIRVHPWLKSCSAHQRVFHAVSQGLEGGGDDVFAHSDGAPFAMAIAGRDQDTGLGRGAGGAVDDADLVICKFQFAQLREEFGQRLPQRAVERVYRTVALGHRVGKLVLDPYFHRGFANGAGTVAARRDVISLESEWQ